MPEWVRVAHLDECQGEGCLLKAQVNGQAIVLARWKDEIFALEDCCSHEDFPLSEGEVEDGELECILHGARFDLGTGKAVRLPAVRPVRTFAVEVRGEDVFVEVEP